MKTRFDYDDGWVTARGDRLTLEEMTTDHLLNLYGMLIRRPDRTMSILIADVESGDFSENVWVPRRESDTEQSIHNITSVSADDLVEYALNSPLGVGVREELIKRGVQIDNALSVIASVKERG